MCTFWSCSGGAEGESSAYMFIVVTDCSDSGVLVGPLPRFWPQFPVDESHMDDDIISTSVPFFCFRRRRRLPPTKTTIQTMIRTSRRPASGTPMTIRRNKPMSSVVGLTASPLGGPSVPTTTQRVGSIWSWFVIAVTHTLYVELSDRFPMT